MFIEQLLPELLNVNIDENEESFSKFLDICKKILNYHEPCKQKFARGNHLPFMNKILSKEIMQKTGLRNRNYYDNRNDYDKREF